MAHSDEIPSDAEVRGMLQDGPMTAEVLVARLESEGHTRRDVQRAIRRCLDRGLLTLGRDLQIELTRVLEDA